MGVTEEEKMALALHNATLQAVPYNALDVVSTAPLSTTLPSSFNKLFSIHVHLAPIFRQITAAEVPRLGRELA